MISKKFVITFTTVVLFIILSLIYLNNRFDKKSTEVLQANKATENNRQLSYSIREEAKKNSNLTEDLAKIQNNTQNTYQQKNNPIAENDVPQFLSELDDYEENKSFYHSLYIRTGIKKGFPYHKKNKAVHEIVHLERGADVAILSKSYYRESVLFFLKKLKEPLKIIDKEFSPDIFQDQPVLVIASGQLYKLSKAQIFKQALGEFVKMGGILITLAQYMGHDFSVLPVPEGESLKAYGWEEDQGIGSESVYTETWHPSLSSIEKEKITLPIDGYFSQFPSRSKVLLRKTRNNEPVMISYPCGKGTVLVMSLYEDMAESINKATYQGKAILRDLVSWAKNPNLKIPAINLKKDSTHVALNLEIKNSSDETASRVKILWLDPNRELLFHEEKEISLPAGKNAVIPISRSFTKKELKEKGIWHVDYILEDQNGKEIQPQAESDTGRYAITNPPEAKYKPAVLGLNVTGPKLFHLDSEHIYQIHVSNQGSEEKNLHLYIWWSRTDKCFLWKDVLISAGKTLTEEFKASPPQNTKGLWVFAFVNNGEKTEKYKKHWWADIIKKIQEKFDESWPFVNMANKGIRFKNYRVSVGEDAEYGSISGQITKEDTGEGLEDVQALLVSSTSKRIKDYASTDKNGEFLLKELKSGQYNLYFITGESSNYFIHHDTYEKVPESEIIQLEEGLYVKVLRKARLGGAVRVKFKQRDDTFFSLPPDRYLLIHFSGGMKGHKFIHPGGSEKPPELFLNRLPPAVYTFEVEIKGYIRRKLKDVNIEKGQTTDIVFNIDLTDPTGIEGKVVDAQNEKPIPSFPLTVLKDKERISPRAMRSDRDGGFSLVGLTPGIYEIWHAKKKIKKITVSQRRKTQVLIKWRLN